VATSGNYVPSVSDVDGFRVVQALAVGPNLITDSLSLTTPFARVVQIHDNVTGAVIGASITLETANTFTVTVGAVVAAARITSVRAS